jgi:Zn-dependent M16 (insulinase) family peptidase
MPQPVSDFAAGNALGFLLERDEWIEELGARALIYRHEATGARLLSVIIDDENKVFGVSLRTPPEDSTGLPHILEHSVLGGSQKYPLKDPFFEMVKGSLKTYLNAFTAPDRTTYPVASTNLKDFYNLVDVYLDAVFFPLLTPHHLDQEGWHFELDAPDAALGYKGVVFNEMKGVYSSPEGLMGRFSARTLFPDTPYRHDSGGDPTAIPDLTFDAFRDFHSRYYHPSNAIFYFYGDDDPARRLELLAELMERFEAQPAAAPIPLQPPFAEPVRHTFPFGVDGESDSSRRSLISVTWKLGEEADPARRMLLRILSYALVGTQASPLRKALLDSGLGEDAFGGVGMSYREVTFGAGMRNIASNNERAIEAVEALILETIERVAREGFEPEMIEAAVNSIEFSLRENNTGGMPRGLSLMMRAMNSWGHDGDPIAPLRFEPPLAWVKEQLAENPRVLGDLLRTLLLENSHRVTLVMQPDADYNARLDADEQERLRAARAAMGDDEVERVILNTATLRARQSAADPPELLAALPSLDIDDLDRTNRPIPTEITSLGGEGDVTLLQHDLHTSGILYLTLGFDLSRVPQTLLPYAELYSSLLTQMGTEREDYVRISQRIGRKTGGIGASTYLASVQGRQDPAAWLFVGGKATTERVPDLLELIHDLLLTGRLDDRERLRQIVRKAKAGMEASIVPAGNSYVDSRLRAAFSKAGALSEELDGIASLAFLRQLSNEIEKDFDGLVDKLRTVRDLLVARPGALCNATIDGENWATIEPQVAALFDALPGADAPRTLWSPEPYPAHEGLTAPTQVNYVGLGANLASVGYEFHGSLNVITNLVRTDWLLQKIRVQGGAYGASMSYGRQSNVLTFTSYRDPNLLSSLDSYAQTADFLEQLRLSPRELTRAIIGAISNFDPYELPDAKGSSALRSYLVGESDERHQQIREEILGTTPQQIRAFADVLRSALPDARTVVLGSPDAIATANAARANWLTVQRVI